MGVGWGLVGAGVEVLLVAVLLLLVAGAGRAHRSRVRSTSWPDTASERATRADLLLKTLFPTFYGKLAGRKVAPKPVRASAESTARAGTGAVGIGLSGKSGLGTAPAASLGVPNGVSGDALRNGRPDAGATGIALIRTVEDLLRTGMPAGQAWQRAGVPTTSMGLPHLEGITAHLLKDPRRIAAASGSQPPKHERQTATRIAHMIVAGCKVAQNLGVSLASVLTAIVDVIENDISAQEERRIVLAGPKMSAIMLQMLPLIGVIGGVLLGVGPLDWFFGSALGLANLAIGLGLLAVGRAWTGRLIARAA